MESKSRETFEAVYDAQKHDRFVSNEDWAWKFWQASRAALVVELPENFTTSMYGTALVELPFVEQAIRAVGITVKGEGDVRQS